MGKFKLLLGISIVLRCCYQDNSNIPKISKLENIALSDNLPDRNKIYRCFNKACEIEYEKEIDDDHWQTLSEVEKSKKGDCEDMSLYLSYLLDKNGIKNKLAAGYLNSSDMLNNSRNFHSWVYVKIDNEWNVLDPSVKAIIPVNGIGETYESLGDSNSLIERLFAFKKTYEGSVANIILD